MLLKYTNVPGSQRTPRLHLSSFNKLNYLLNQFLLWALKLKNRTTSRDAGALFKEKKTLKCHRCLHYQNGELPRLKVFISSEMSVDLPECQRWAEAGRVNLKTLVYCRMHGGKNNCRNSEAQEQRNTGNNLRAHRKEHWLGMQRKQETETTGRAMTVDVTQNRQRLKYTG